MSGATPQGVPGHWARFGALAGLTAAADGTVFVADRGLHVVRAIAPDGRVWTHAGDGYRDNSYPPRNGPARTAQFWHPSDVAVGPDGSLYVADSGNRCIRRIDAEGNATTLAGDGERGFRDGQAAQAQFFLPVAVAVDGAGTVVVADRGNCRIRRITPDGTVSTLAGSGEQGTADGPAERAQFTAPSGLAVAPDGIVFVAEGFDANSIRAISPDGQVRTLVKADAGLFDPAALALLPDGRLVVADSRNHRSVIVGVDGAVLPLAGALAGEAGYADGHGVAARFRLPLGMAAHAGAIFVADSGNARIRRVDLEGHTSTLAGSGLVVGWQRGGFLDGPGDAAILGDLVGIAVAPSGTVWVTDDLVECVRRITTDGTVGTVVGSGRRGVVDGPAAEACFDRLGGLVRAADGVRFVLDWGAKRVRRIERDGTVSTLEAPLEGAGISGIGLDGKGDLLLVAQGDRALLRLPRDGGELTTFVFPGGQDSQYIYERKLGRPFVQHPAHAIGAADGTIYIADSHGNRIWTLKPDGELRVLAGDRKEGLVDGPGADARFFHPAHLAFGPAGEIYVADLGNHAIRRVTPDGSVSQLPAAIRLSHVTAASQMALGAKRCSTPRAPSASMQQALSTSPTPAIIACDVSRMAW